MWFSIQKFIITALMRIVGVMPLCVHHFNARWVSFLLEKVVRYRVKLVDSNLAHAFPEKTPEERLGIRHAFYRQFANIFLEALWFGACGSRRFKRSKAVTFINAEETNAFFEKANGVIVMAAHNGNWELLGGFRNFDYLGKEICFNLENSNIVHYKLSSKVMDSVMRDNRLAHVPDRDNFKGYLESREVLKHVLRHKDEKNMYIMITDQRPYVIAKRAVPVHFMNRDCMSMTAAATLASKLSMGVMFQRMRLNSHGKYTLEYVPMFEDASKVDVELIVKRFYELLEEDIRYQPFNYLWTHNRWKQ